MLNSGRGPVASSSHHRIPVVTLDVVDVEGQQGSQSSTSESSDGRKKWVREKIAGLAVRAQVKISTMCIHPGEPERRQELPDLAAVGGRTALPHLCEPKSVGNLDDPSTPTSRQHKTTPHLSPAQFLSFTSANTSRSHSDTPRLPVSCSISQPWATPTSTSLRSTRSVFWLYVASSPTRAPPPLSPRLLGRDQEQREKSHQDQSLTTCSSQADATAHANSGHPGAPM